MAPIRLVTRAVPPRTAWALEQAGLHPLLARLFAARGVRHADELDDALARLLPPAGLLGADHARSCSPTRSAPAATSRVVADYDCDSATACAGRCAACASAPIGDSAIVPDRRVHGYGLTRGSSTSRSRSRPGADDGRQRHRQHRRHRPCAGTRARPVITEHHLPLRAATRRPSRADIIVSPNQRAAPSRANILPASASRSTCCCCAQAARSR
jgi:single-stranded-DNA-specific exonuclease